MGCPPNSLFDAGTAILAAAVLGNGLSTAERADYRLLRSNRCRSGSGRIISHREAGSGGVLHLIDGILDLRADVQAVIILLRAEIGAEAGRMDVPAVRIRSHLLFAGLDVTARNTEFHIVEVRIADANLRLQVIRILISGRIVADQTAALVLLLQLVTAFLNVEIAAECLRKIKYIGVGLRQVGGRGHHKLTRVVIDVQLGVLTERSRDMKSGNRSLILLTIGKLLLDVCLGAVASLAEPRRKLRSTFLAHVSVLELFVAQKTDFVTAKITVFLIKESHGIDLPFLFDSVIVP